MSQWIDCKTQMPPENMDILIAYKIGDVHYQCVAKYDASYFYSQFFETQGCHGYEWENYYEDKDVTHWKMLDENPKT